MRHVGARLVRRRRRRDPELICGGFTAGGSHNAAWAISSGTWAGQGAAAHALFVAPEADVTVVVREQTLEDNRLLGSYRAAIDWGEGRSPGARNDQSFRVLGPTTHKKAAPVQPR